MTTTTTAPPATVEGLRPLSPQRLPFDRRIEARAFLLERDTGNVLIYSNGELARDADLLRARGVARQYLNHWHESIFGGLADAGISAPLFVHADDAEQTSERLTVRGAFTRRHTFEDDFEVIPIPGHTPGATAYLWDSGAHRVLFTGDSLYVREGEWDGAVLDSSDRERYLESLALLRGLDFDVLAPWAATAGDPPYVPVRPGEAAERIDAVIERIRTSARG